MAIGQVIALVLAALAAESAKKALDPHPVVKKNTERLDALFAKIEKERSVKIEARDKGAGEFKLTYLPITPDPAPRPAWGNDRTRNSRPPGPMSA